MSFELEVAERALRLVDAGDGVQATACRERSLMLRFAHSRPTQATSVDDLTVELTVLRDGHPGSATTNSTEPDALAACGRAATSAAEAAARMAARGAYPGLPAPTATRDHEGHDPETAQVEARRGTEALEVAFAAAARHRVAAYGAWSAAEVSTAIAVG